MSSRFTELRRAARAAEGAGRPAARLAVVGDFATQHLAAAVKGACAERGLALEVLDADYDQIEGLTVDPGSELYAFDPDYVLFCRCAERLHEEYAGLAPADRRGLAARRAEETRCRWGRVRDRCGATILELNYAEVDDRVFGDFGNSVEGSFISQVRRLNVALMDAAASTPGARVVDVAGVRSEMGAGAFSDPKLYLAAHMPLSLDAVCRVAESVAAAVDATRGRIRKCVVCDLDGTLWGGVVGDDGPSGIRVGDLGDGPAFTELQGWLRLLRERGVLLAVCSKNDEPNAREPFESNPEMVLRLSDFAAFVSNWDDKAENVRRIRRDLNIGLDSMVFLDDNPFERGLVRSMLPDVTVPELPEDPSLRVSYLRSLDLFEAASYSEEDASRTEQYAAEGRRRESEAEFADYGEYLGSLGMVAACRPFDDFRAPRVAQLTQRSNQFNLRTARYDEAGIRRMMADPAWVTRYITLRDRFGDSGLVSVIAMRDDGDGSLFVDTWLMSCRVLRRGVEDFAMNRMVEAARGAGFRRIVGEYLPTRKNGMVRGLYRSMGFRPAGESGGGGELWELDVDGYEDRETYIEEEK